MTSATKPALVKPVLDVIFEPDGGKRVKVIPPTIHVKDPESLNTIRWINKTEETLHVWLPSVRGLVNSTEDGKKDLLKAIRIEPGEPLVVYVNEEALVGEWEHEYHVFCEGSGNFAVGNSPPTMSCP